MLLLQLVQQTAEFLDDLIEVPLLDFFDVGLELSVDLLLQGAQLRVKAVVELLKKLLFHIAFDFLVHRFVVMTGGRLIRT